MKAGSYVKKEFLRIFYKVHNFIYLTNRSCTVCFWVIERELYSIYNTITIVELEKIRISVRSRIVGLKLSPNFETYLRIFTLYVYQSTYYTYPTFLFLLYTHYFLSTKGKYKNVIYLDKNNDVRLDVHYCFCNIADHSYNTLLAVQRTSQACRINFLIHVFPDLCLSQKITKF